MFIAVLLSSTYACIYSGKDSVFVNLNNDITLELTLLEVFDNGLRSAEHA